VITKVTIVTSSCILFYHRRTVIRQMMAVEELITPVAMLTQAIITLVAILTQAIITPVAILAQAVITPIAMTRFSPTDRRQGNERIPRKRDQYRVSIRNAVARRSPL
jgi:hypothetical protein